MDRRLLVLALGMFALGTDSFVVAGVLPQLSQTFDVPIGAAGQMTTVYAITYALMAPTIAALAARVPRKTLLISSLVIFVAANLATAMASNFAIALATRMVAGLGAAMFAPTATGTAAMIVVPEKRGFALSVVIAGLTGATALGSPIGAMIGGLSDWRWTMVFVSALAAASAVGVGAMLSHVPLPPKLTLMQRVAPAADQRVALTLVSTLLYMTGQFIIYTYFTVVFDRVLGGNTLLTGALLVLWGSCGTACNLLVGRLIDSVGSRGAIVSMLSVLAVVLATLHWTGTRLWTAVIALAVWGAVGWGLLAPQQHRLVSIAPQTAPVVLGLNTSFTYLGVTAAGLIGAYGIRTVDGHHLGIVGAVFVVASIVVAELATWSINARKADDVARLKIA
jgi:predicted MFS family arabinose efflux permease